MYGTAWDAGPPKGGGGYSRSGTTELLCFRFLKEILHARHQHLPYAWRLSERRVDWKLPQFVFLHGQTSKSLPCKYSVGQRQLFNIFPFQQFLSC